VSGILTVVVSVTIIYFVCLYLNYRDSGKWRWGPPEEEKGRHQMTPAVRKLVEAARQIIADRMADSSGYLIPLSMAISAVEAEAATGERPKRKSSYLCAGPEVVSSVYLCSDADPIFAALESKLTAIGALVEKGMPPLELPSDFLFYDQAGRNGIMQGLRERQYTELLSQIGSILGEK